MTSMVLWNVMSPAGETVVRSEGPSAWIQVLVWMLPLIVLVGVAVLALRWFRRAASAR